uniref:Acetyl-coenzyme A synthetase n=1 Tax=Strigamia maritima TaxID=126957 RepID=T1J915_STRMM
MASSSNGSSSATAVYEPNARIRKEAHITSMDQYREMYRLSIDDPDKFWGEIAKEFYFHEESPTKRRLVYNLNVSEGPVEIKFMAGAKLNICYNALDRNIKEKKYAKNIAYYWVGNDPKECAQITYAELLILVCKFANVLKSKGVKKGDRIAVYMPMIIELVVTMLACARIGAVHSVVFGGFSADSLTERLIAAQCKIIVTADGTWRGPKLINLKEIVDDALTKARNQNHVVETCIVVQHLGNLSSNMNKSVSEDEKHPSKRFCHDLKTSWNTATDFWWHDLIVSADESCAPEWMDAEDDLFMLYTSGSTGKPKGVVHSIAGYMVYAATTFKYVFDHHQGDVFWCTADIGWITGHTYVVYGPLLDGATSVMFEGIPFYPDASRYWQIIEKYKVSKFYTAPTAIRALMKYGDEFVTKHNCSSLKILGSVGEPINPEAWLWYYNVVGNKKCVIVDTFWQTETGGHVLTPIPGATPAKPGSATFPFFGVIPAILSEEGKELEGPAEGYLVFKRPWPGMMRTLYGDHERFETTYFKKFPGYYCTGDGARRDEDGYYWVTGRVDDMLNVSGHLLSTAQVESCLIEHAAVSEAAVVSHPHPVKGECLYCFVTLKEVGNFILIDSKLVHNFCNELIQALRSIVRKKIGPFASPEYVQHAPGLPKTRSGKIMRRVLRKIASNDRDMGDISTLADESVVEQLFSLRPKDVAV